MFSASSRVDALERQRGGALTDESAAPPGPASSPVGLVARLRKSRAGTRHPQHPQGRGYSARRRHHGAGSPARQEQPERISWPFVQKAVRSR
jgi:hypothetical protein